tara:strand:+ start:1173 stop:1826 length:654 start_codon:yes stop_codon:yes gene_type:complete
MAAAVDFDITIDNITRGLYFTPIAVVAHAADVNLFASGVSASTELQTMAETGEIEDLARVLTSSGATMDNNPAAGLLAPGATATSTLDTINATANTQLSIVAMVLPSNDGFVGLNAVDIPTEAGTYTFYANAYDAGTEANDELRGGGDLNTPGFPVPEPLNPVLGTGGTGVTTTTEGFVHIHRGNLGDANTAGGISDVDSRVQRWLNPVARITVTVR